MLTFRVASKARTPGLSTFCLSDYAGWRWQMTGFISRVRIPKTLAITAILIALAAHSSLLAQMPPDSSW